MSQSDLQKLNEEFRKVQGNPIYFLDQYFNKVSTKKLQLTDEEKQLIYNKYKTIPLVKGYEQFKEHFDLQEKRKAQGLKDWEEFTSKK